MDYEKAYKEAIKRAKSFRTPDNKDVAAYIFPELAESEDERIRKDIISLVIKWWKDDGEVESEFSSKNSMLDWLEKRGKPTDIPADAVLDGNKDGLIADTVRRKREKQSRQKPVEWSEEDENLLKLSLENLTELKDRFGEEYGKVGDCIVFLESIKDRYTWRPSNAQIESIKQAVLNMKNSACYDSVLVHLLQDLKKLRGK